MTAAASQRATVRCQAIPLGIGSPQRSCVVAVRWGDHGLFASVDPHVVGGPGKPRVSGALVALSAG